MKQIQLREGITLMAVEVDEPQKYNWAIPKTKTMVGDSYLQKYNSEGWQPHTNLGDGDFTILGTSQDFLAREDAEEVCRKYVEYYGKAALSEADEGLDIYRDYNSELTGWDINTAKASFQSALTAMNYVDGEILIIKQGEGK